MCELVLEIEEAFGISLTDEQAENITTVGDLYAAVLVATAGKTRSRNVCLSARTFYELRRYILLHVAEGKTTVRIAPSTSLIDLIPRSHRRRTWGRMAIDLNLRFPALRWPLTITLLGWSVAIVIALFCFMSIYGTLTFEYSVFVTLLAFSLSLCLYFSLTVPLATSPASTFLTMRGLTEQLLARNGSKLADRHDAFSARDVWTILCLILMEQLGVDREKIVPDAHLVRDLGYD